jgi:hypothetical protein
LHSGTNFRIFTPMKAIDLNSTKLELIKWISSLNDDKVLELINSFRISKTDKDWWEELSDQQKKEIEMSLKDLDEGKGISSEEFWKKHG